MDIAFPTSMSNGHLHPWPVTMVLWPVINLRALQCARSSMEIHVNTTHRHVWAMLPSALAVLWRFYLVLSALSQQCIGKINIRPNMGLCSVPLRLVLLRGVKDCAKRLFQGGAGQNGGAQTNWISQHFCCDRRLWCIRMHSGCWPQSL